MNSSTQSVTFHHQFIKQPPAAFFHIPPSGLKIVGVPWVGHLAGPIGIIHQQVHFLKKSPPQIRCIFRRLARSSPAFFAMSFITNSANGLLQIFPWQTNKIFVIAYISLQKPPSLDVSWLLALFSFLLSCRKPTQISVTLRRFPGKWCSNWCSGCDCFNLIFSAVPVRQTL